MIDCDFGNFSGGINIVTVVIVIWVVAIDLLCCCSFVVVSIDVGDWRCGWLAMMMMMIIIILIDSHDCSRC